MSPCNLCNIKTVCYHSNLPSFVNLSVCICNLYVYNKDIYDFFLNKCYTFNNSFINGICKIVGYLGKPSLYIIYMHIPCTVHAFNNLWNKIYIPWTEQHQVTCRPRNGNSFHTYIYQYIACNMWINELFNFMFHV